MGEDELIQTIFAPLAAGFAGSFGLKDDAAVLAPPADRDLVLTMDAVAEGVHFFADDAAADVGWKALAVNASDLAAKGATPLAYLMSVSFPTLPPRDWLEGFARGLSEAQAAFSIVLAGGDTDRRPGPLTVCVTAIGALPKGAMVRRSAARAGDFLYASGSIGDSALGLGLRGRGLSAQQIGLDAESAAYLIGRYLRPQPRLALAPVLLSHAHAAMDISDGLIKDCGRLAAASGVRAEIESSRVPLSAAASRAVGAKPELLELTLTGGDDYEVLAAVAPEEAAAFEAAAAATGEHVTRIGRLTDGTGVLLTALDGRPLAVKTAGWDHFPG